MFLKVTAKFSECVFFFITFSHKALVISAFLPSHLFKSGLSSLHSVCQQVLKEEPLRKVARLSISRHETTQKGPRHKLRPRLDRQAHCWSQGWTFSFLVDYTEGFGTVSLSADKITPFLRVIYERLQAHMWICRRWQPEGRQTPAYQREELKGCSIGGRLTIFTSIALCGRHFEGTSSLKTSGLDFHVRQNLFASLSSDFM